MTHPDKKQLNDPELTIPDSDSDPDQSVSSRAGRKSHVADGCLPNRMGPFHLNTGSLRDGTPHELQVERSGREWPASRGPDSAGPDLEGPDSERTDFRKSKFPKKHKAENPEIRQSGFSNIKISETPKVRKSGLRITY